MGEVLCSNVAGFRARVWKPDYVGVTLASATSCVTLAKLLTLSGLYFLICKVRLIEPGS